MDYPDNTIGGRITLDPYPDDDQDDDETLTVCDRCGDEIPLAEANSVDEEGHEWQYATLCNDCHTEVVTDFIANAPADIRDLLADNAALEQELAQAQAQDLAALRALLAGAVPLLELAAELVARLRCHNCPVHSRCPRFDSTTTTTASDWPCTTIPAKLRELAQGLRALEEEEEEDDESENCCYLPREKVRV